MDHGIFIIAYFYLLPVQYNIRVLGITTTTVLPVENQFGTMPRRQDTGVLHAIEFVLAYSQLATAYCILYTVYLIHTWQNAIVVSEYSRSESLIRLNIVYICHM